MLPELFSANVNALQARMLYGLSGHFFPCNHEERTTQEIGAKHFVDNVQSTSGIMRYLLRKEWKGEQSNKETYLDRLKLLYLPGYGYHKLARAGADQFFLDGYHSFVLVDKENGIGVCVSVDSPLGPFVKFDKFVKKGYLSPDDIVIIQLQAQLSNWKTFRQSRNQPVESDALNSVRWELVLTDLASLWARNSGFERIYMVPANQHPQFMGYAEQEDEYGEKRFHSGKMRYDVTARRLGFKPDDKTGLLKRDLRSLSPVSYQKLFEDFTRGHY